MLNLDLDVSEEQGSSNLHGPFKYVRSERAVDHQEEATSNTMS
jgi:hypothetical protein